MLPKDFLWLASEPGPKMLKEALALYGTAEIAGKPSSEIILAWARALELKSYTKDETPWCGLFVAYAAYRAGCLSGLINPLWAKNWLKWGAKVSTAMLGDVLVFTREGGGHVGIYVAQCATHYWVLGGNQSDKVCITAIPKAKCIGIRRREYSVTPANVRQIFMNIPIAQAGSTNFA